jgi:Ran GTPase-activating protein (RanGAP) involved in mRNA processing and transport
MIGYTYVEERKLLEIKMKNQEKLRDSTFEQLFYNSLGIQHFAIAFANTDRIKVLDLSENDIGQQNFMLLMPVFESNTQIAELNVADCKLDGDCARELCSILKEKNSALSLLKFRNSNLGEEGANAIAELIRDHLSLTEIEMFNCNIAEEGGNAIGNALKTNFCIEKLSIGDNTIFQRDVEQIQQSVIFNT